jgi:glycerate-2-kinase
MFLATDGIDGITPPGGRSHSGAVINGDSVALARAAGVDPVKALAAHNSHAFVRAIDTGGAGERTIVPAGPTGTNVNDIWVGLAD